MKEESDKIQRVIADHEKKRNSIIGEYDLEHKLKILEQHKKHEEDMEYKKKNLSLKSLTKKITKFQNILIADDSSSEDDDIDSKQQQVSINITDTTSAPGDLLTQTENLIIRDIESQEQIVDNSENIITNTINDMITDISNNSN